MLCGRRVVVTHRGRPEGWDPAGLFHFVDGIEAAVVFASGKRCSGSVDAQHPQEDPDAVIQGNRVLHLRFQVRRGPC